MQIECLPCIAEAKSPSPPGPVKVSFSVPVEFFSVSVRKHGKIDYTPVRAISVTYMHDNPKGFFPQN